MRDFWFYRKSAVWIRLGQLGVILFCLWYVLLLLLGSSRLLVTLQVIAVLCQWTVYAHAQSESVVLPVCLLMFCCCCSVLSLTYVFAAFELTAYQTAMWVWLTITTLHSSQYIGSVFFMHTWTEYGQHFIKSHRFPLHPPCPGPWPHVAPPTSDSWRRPWTQTNKRVSYRWHVALNSDTHSHVQTITRHWCTQFTAETAAGLHCSNSGAPSCVTLTHCLQWYTLHELTIHWTHDTFGV